MKNNYRTCIYGMLILIVCAFYKPSMCRADEPDSLWLKMYNTYLDKYEGANEDSTVYYHWKAFDMAMAIHNDSLQLIALGDLRNSKNVDSLQSYIAIIDTFPSSKNKMLQANRLKTALCFRKGRQVEGDEKHRFIEEMIYKADSVYADSIHKDSLSYLLNNRVYLSGLLSAVDFQSTTSPFYEYFNRFNKMVMKLPKELFIDKLNSFILASTKYLALKDYKNALLYSEYIIDYMIYSQGKPIELEELSVRYAAIVYFMCYQQLCCYDDIPPLLLERNWKFMNSPRGLEGKKFINTFNRELYWADIYYAMCTKDYEKAIDLCNKEIMSPLNDQNRKLMFARVQNVAIERVGHGERYEFYLTRNFYIVRRQFQEELYDNQTDYSSLYHLIRLKRILSAESLEHQQHMSQWTTLLFISAIVLFLLGVWGMILTLHTIRKRKVMIQVAREESRLAKKEHIAAERLNELQVKYMHNMNHEIRTPLNAIAGFSQLLAEDKELDKESRKEFGHHIAESSEMLLQLINDALDTAQLEAGQYTIHNDTHALWDICRQATQTMHMRQLENVDLILDFQIPKDTAAYTDKTRVLQVLFNYLSNACKHTKDGSITLSCGWAKGRKGYIEFAVTDTGTGVPPEKIDQLFQRFAKLDRDSQGTGLGLNICASLAVLLKGEVAYDESYTDGARFLFYIPLVADAKETGEVAE